MIRVNIQDAKAHLSAYLRDLDAGETMLLCNRNEPVAEIRRLPPARKTPRPIGIDKGKLEIPAAFFEPLPADLLTAFGEEAPLGS